MINRNGYSFSEQNLLNSREIAKAGKGEGEMSSRVVVKSTLGMLRATMGKGGLPPHDYRTFVGCTEHVYGACIERSQSGLRQPRAEGNKTHVRYDAPGPCYASFLPASK